MKYQTIIFDFDGTLADTSPGISNCHRYAHRMMGHAEPSEDVLRGVIGGPLIQTYQTIFGFSMDEAKRAVAFYRKHYAESGIYEAALYPGMRSLLQTLKNAGCCLGIATLKAERFLEVMLRNMGIQGYFDTVHGMDESDSRTKAQLIQLCMEDLHAVPEDTVLVGDSIHDREGARHENIAFLGVTYGFGFKKTDVIDGVLLVDDVQGIGRIFDE